MLPPRAGLLDELRAAKRDILVQDELSHDDFVQACMEMDGKVEADGL